MDNKLSFEKHISGVCSACSLQIKALRHIRPLLDVPTANAIACSAINSRLDYCNSLFAGMSMHNVHRLQRLQNATIKIVGNAGRNDSPSTLLYRFHWLPVRQRIDYKVALLTFKALSFGSPVYIRELLTRHEPVRELRSSAACRLHIPSESRLSALVSRSFSHYAPKLWNSLTSELRSLASVDGAGTASIVDCFKRRLKSELFTRAFPGPTDH